MLRRRELLLGSGGVAASLAGCLGPGDGDGDSRQTQGELLVAVTTSTYDAGLLGKLHEECERRFGVTLRTISGGTGENLRRGEAGDVDVVMAHAPGLEAEFVHDGYGVDRHRFADGDFVVAGPPDDPAGIGGVEEAAVAFERIADENAPFLSRGDGSGTHIAERRVWEDAGIEPRGEWYQESGQGMGGTLVQAGQYGAYLLTVRANHLDVRPRVDLTSFVEGPLTGGDPILDNPYSVIAVDPSRHPGVEYELAMLYIGFLTGPTGRELIEEFEIDGEQPFVPP